MGEDDDVGVQRKLQIVPSGEVSAEKEHSLPEGLRGTLLDSCIHLGIELVQGLSGPHQRFNDGIPRRWHVVGLKDEDGRVSYLRENGCLECLQGQIQSLFHLDIDLMLWLVTPDDGS